ncbi:radical SAM family heme chaperone HemW [Aureibaculum flavum]|uniref:radical SAM family heme chaperone HemW n=1 Tax=Aureibaculum flavum TaxID=2795986 RepID=UPI00293D6DAD|nr:radical SAM family heme chaperone HemW [Aureibaculum flavum]
MPFCKQACHYCDFHFSTSLQRKEEMIQAIAKEIVLRKSELNEVIETIYFGGGTPSLLSTEELHYLIDTVYKNYSVIEHPEITLEANPDDLTKEKIQELAISPVNRLSIGIQSFFEEDLQTMNRSHNSEQAKNCLEEATRHFDNITVDLIYGIPNMSNERWQENLQTVFDFGINHISSYALTVEPKTALASFIRSGKYPNVSEELALEHFNILVAATEKNGFVNYEVSNFGKPNYFSKHNTSYWLGKSYLGFGPSAHSFNGKQRSWNVSNNIKYNKALRDNIIPNETETLSQNDVFNETIMIGLRTIWGIDLKHIENHFSTSFKDKLIANADKFIQKELLELTKDQKLKITKKGRFLADGIASDLFLVH